MSVLITGGTGAVGSVTARHLVKMGIEPILYNRSEDYSLLDDVRKNVVFAKGDILDPANLSRTLNTHGVRTIVHTASLLSKADPKQSIRINTQGTVNVLWAAVDGGIDRVVYTSSKAVYNEIKGRHAHPDYEPINEDYPKDEPLGIYGVTKFFGEQLGNEFHKNFGIDFLSLRFSTVYGPGRLLKNPNSPMVVPCRIIESAMSGRPFRYPRGAGQRDDYLYLDDAGRATALACAAGDLKHRAINVGTGTGSTLVDFALATQKVFPGFEYEIGPGLDHAGIGFSFYSVYDTSRAARELGFTAGYSLEDAVEDYVETMKKLRIAPVLIP